MRKFISFNFAPVMQATYILDDATFNAVKEYPDEAIGKTVALTGPATVGFGSANNLLLGVLEKVESDKFCTVRTGWYSEGVNIGEATLTAGTVVKVDGKGGLVAATPQTAYGPMVIRIDTAADTGLAKDTAVIKY